jgi:hypothetical protein
VVAALNVERRQGHIVIKEVPVYIEKDVIVEVPVPIYINQKEENANARVQLADSSAEENSIAVNEVNESI